MVRVGEAVVRRFRRGGVRWLFSGRKRPRRPILPPFQLLARLPRLVGTMVLMVLRVPRPGAKPGVGTWDASALRERPSGNRSRRGAGRLTKAVKLLVTPTPGSLGFGSTQRLGQAVVFWNGENPSRSHYRLAVGRSERLWLQGAPASAQTTRVRAASGNCARQCRVFCLVNVPLPSSCNVAVNQPHPPRPQP